jgi:hypothetical protein
VSDRWAVHSYTTVTGEGVAYEDAGRRAALRALPEGAFESWSKMFLCCAVRKRFVKPGLFASCAQFGAQSCKSFLRFAKVMADSG